MLTTNMADIAHAADCLLAASPTLRQAKFYLSQGVCQCCYTHSRLPPCRGVTVRFTGVRHAPARQLRARLGVPQEDETWDTVARWPREREQQLAEEVVRVTEWKRLLARAQRSRSQLPARPLSRLATPTRKLISELLTARKQLRQVRAVGVDLACTGPHTVADSA